MLGFGLKINFKTETQYIKAENRPEIKKPNFLKPTILAD